MLIIQMNAIINQHSDDHACYNTAAAVNTILKRVAVGAAEH